MIKIELCVASPEGISLADKYNLDRIELCQNLEIGGVTPSMGLVDLAIQKKVETHALVRPRMGGFNYSEDDFALMQLDIHRLEEAGVSGIVIGALVDNNKLAVEPLRKIRKAFPNLEFTFHRAFDDLNKWQYAVDELHNLGFSRVLTSGMAASVDVGLSNLSYLQDTMKGKLELMIGGGVNEKNIPRILSRIQPDAIHFSATKLHVDDNASRFSVPRLIVDEKKLKDLLFLVKGSL